MFRLCTVVRSRAIHATGAPQLFFDYNNLQFSDLTTNRVVGSSNLSGRAKKDKGSPSGALFLFLTSDKIRTPEFDPRRALARRQASPRSGVPISPEEQTVSLIESDLLHSS